MYSQSNINNGIILDKFFTKLIKVNQIDPMFKFCNNFVTDDSKNDTFKYKGTMI